MATNWSYFFVRSFQILLLFILLLSCVAGQVCTYYGNYRYAATEDNLSNCSWYKAMSCCKRTEVSSVFGSMFKLQGYTKACHSRLNYMMCYFCSPNQINWYDSKVVICADFCEETFDKCKTAQLGNRSISDVYKDGRELCEANSFEVVPGRDRCFSFDPTVFDGADRTRAGSSLCLGIVALVTALLRF